MHDIICMTSFPLGILHDIIPSENTTDSSPHYSPAGSNNNKRDQTKTANKVEKLSFFCGHFLKRTVDMNIKKFMAVYHK